MSSLTALPARCVRRLHAHLLAPPPHPPVCHPLLLRSAHRGGHGFPKGKHNGTHPPHPPHGNHTHPPHPPKGNHTHNETGHHHGHGRH